MMISFPKKAIEKKDIISEIELICSSDYDYKNHKILNSICSDPLEISKQVFYKYINANLGDIRIFKGAGIIEERTISYLGKLLQNRKCFGTSVNGGTEANLMAMYSAKRKKSKIYKPNVVLPKSAHFSFNKIFALLDIEPRYIPIDNNFRANLKDVDKLIDNNTIAIVATAGTSECGAIDPIYSMSSIAQTYNIYFHIDAASGGLIIPFLRKQGYRLEPCDFSIGHVNSITIDPHKYGLSVIPCGFILFSNEEDFRNIKFPSHYLGTKDHYSFAGTKSGAGVIAFFAALHSMGEEGYTRLALKYINNRNYLLKLIKDNRLELAFDPDLNIVGIKSGNASKTAKLLREKGWLISVSKRYNFLRIVIANHVTKTALLNFVKDLKKLELGA